MAPEGSPHLQQPPDEIFFATLVIKVLSLYYWCRSFFKDNEVQPKKLFGAIVRGNLNVLESPGGTCNQNTPQHRPKKSLKVVHLEGRGGVGQILTQRFENLQIDSNMARLPLL